MTTPYLDLATLKDALGVTETANEAHIERALEAATAWINSHCGRTFALSTGATKYEYPSDHNTLDVVDLVAVTSIALDTKGDQSYATTLAASDYELLPLNGLRYQQIRMWPTSSQGFTLGRRVRIVGTWGYVESGQPPAAVVQACQLLATRWYTRRDSPLGVIEAPGIDQMARIGRGDVDVAALLRPYVSGSPQRSWVIV